MRGIHCVYFSVYALRGLDLFEAGIAGQEAESMGNFFKDNEDLQFYMDRGIDWDSLIRITELNFQAPDGHESVAEAKEFYTDVLSMLGEFVANEVQPNVAAIDHKKVKLVDGEAVCPPEWDAIFEQLAELGTHGLPIPRELGGMNMPVLTYFMNGEILGRADVSAMTHSSFHAGIAMALLVYSVHEGTTTFDSEKLIISETRFGDAVREIATGAAWGAMDITEPDAGSDMAALKARAVQDEDGNWFITGSKIFITSGHGKYHIVIARSEPDMSLGLEGLSLFLVKAYEDNEDGTRTRYANIVRVEEKLGHNGSATCAMEFDRSPAQLVGRRGEGFRLMLLLMNNARVGVSFECIGIMEAAHRLAREYAAERGSMGKTIDKHEMIADYLDEMENDIYGVRALTMHAAFHEEMAHKLKLYGRAMRAAGRSLEFLGIDSDEALEARIKHHEWESRRMTPLMKYIAAEKSVEHSRRCIQIHGGAGYTKEYGAEKLLRDALVMPIYEGTSQIQSLMAMKDQLGRILKAPQDFLKDVAQTRWRSVSADDELERRVAKIRGAGLKTLQLVLQRTIAAKIKDVRRLPMSEWKAAFADMDPKRDFSYAMLHAERLTRILIDSAITEVLWNQAKEHPERREILERYIERAEPRVRFLYDEINTTGTRLLRRLSPDQDSRAAE